MSSPLPPMKLEYRVVDSVRAQLVRTDDRIAPPGVVLLAGGTRMRGKSPWNPGLPAAVDFVAGGIQRKVP
jgi:hypothetical protein